VNDFGLQRFPNITPNCVRKIPTRMSFRIFKIHLTQCSLIRQWANAVGFFQPLNNFVISRPTHS